MKHIGCNKVYLSIVLYKFIYKSKLLELILLVILPFSKKFICSRKVYEQHKLKHFDSQNVLQNCKITFSVSAFTKYHSIVDIIF